jgi:hypothetical protein
MIRGVGESNINCGLIAILRASLHIPGTFARRCVDNCL